MNIRIAIWQIKFSIRAESELYENFFWELKEALETGEVKEFILI